VLILRDGRVASGRPVNINSIHPWTSAFVQTSIRSSLEEGELSHNELQGSEAVSMSISTPRPLWQRKLTRHESTRAIPSTRKAWKKSVGNSRNRRPACGVTKTKARNNRYSAARSLAHGLDHQSLCPAGLACRNRLQHLGVLASSISFLARAKMVQMRHSAGWHVRESPERVSDIDRGPLRQAMW
jgi:hypothetical protein